MTSKHDLQNDEGAELCRFVNTALALGRAKFAAKTTFDCLDILLGRLSVRFAESEPHLASSVRLCLGGDTAHTATVPDVNLYVDYTSWHERNGFASHMFAHYSLLDINRILAKIGVRAIHNADDKRWDIFDLNDRFGLRLQCQTDSTAPWEVTAPLANFCSWIAHCDDKVMLHAASVSTGNRGALLVGHGGAGKSGTTLGTLMGGMSSAGDDYIQLSTEPRYVAHSIYKTVKQDAKGLERLGLVNNFNLNWQGKAVFCPSDIGASEICQSVPINVILVPKVGARETSFQATSAIEVCKTLTFSTLKQLAWGQDKVFRTCATLVRDLPCYQMNVSADNDEIIEKLTTFLGHLEC